MEVKNSFPNQTHCVGSIVQWRSQRTDSVNLGSQQQNSCILNNGEKIDQKREKEKKRKQNRGSEICGIITKCLISISSDEKESGLKEYLKK